MNQQPAPQGSASDLRAPRWSLLLLFAAVVGANWRLSTTFFWRDEWLHLLHAWWGGAPSYWLEPFFGHFNPLFKLLFRAEIALFGTFTAGYHYLNLLGWLLVSWFSFRLWERWLGSTRWALLAALLLIVHARNASNLLWMHQICVISHLLFQVLYVRDLWRYLQPQAGKRPPVWRLLLWLVLQNYLFSGGVLLPLVGMAGLVWKYGWGRGLRRRLFWLHAVLLVVFAGGLLGVLALFPYASEQAVLSRVLGNPLQVVLQVLQYLGRVTFRFLFVEGAFLGALEGWLGLLLLAGGAALSWWKLPRQRGPLLIALLWLGLNLLVVAVARFSSGGMPNRYLALALAPLITLLAIPLQALVSSLQPRLPRLKWVMLGGFGLVLLGHFGLNLYQTQVYDRRNLLNRLEMEQGLRTDGRYRPYDEPMKVLPEGVAPRSLPDYQRYLAQSYLHAQAQSPLSQLQRPLSPQGSEVELSPHAPAPARSPLDTAAPEAATDTTTLD